MNDNNYKKMQSEIIRLHAVCRVKDNNIKICSNLLNEFYTFPEILRDKYISNQIATVQARLNSIIG